MPYVFYLAGQGVRSVWKKTSRRLLRLGMAGASPQRRIAAERRLRGREQVRKLRSADVVVVSFGKSGRTWLRLLMSRVYQQQHGLPERALLGFDNFHARVSAIPRIFFTHDNYIKDYTGNHDSKADFYGKKVVLLVRDPRDVAVSQFFQWKHRMRPEKKELNDYPEHDADVSMLDFVLSPGGGLPRVIEFMNLWAAEAPRLSLFHVLRYEDLKARPDQTLSKLMAFIGTPASEEQVLEAVRFGSFDNMKKMEQQRTFWLSGGRMVPRDRSNPDSYKVRRAKVGGYRDYFEDQDVARLDALVNETLDPVFGYASTGERTQVAGAA
jgi:alcohol sulfotransferase